MKQVNAPGFAKKVWKMVRVLYVMLRKGISKTKLFMDLHKMMKLGKIAGKNFHNLMFHINHNNNNKNSAVFDINRSPPPGEYEFSCTNSPTSFSLFTKHKKLHRSNDKSKEDLDMMNIHAMVMKAVEMINHSESASPALPGFGRSPMVRQLRVTDSPFPLSGMDEDSHVVDQAAEKFISRFYSDLMRQNIKASPFGSKA